MTKGKIPVSLWVALMSLDIKGVFHSEVVIFKANLNRDKAIQFYSYILDSYLIKDQLL